jgi:hypothetical protein
MNERIKQLAEQAGFNPYNYQGSNLVLFEKFSELIVRECAQVASDWVNEPTMLSIGTKIKYHLGVE